MYAADGMWSAATAFGLFLASFLVWAGRNYAPVSSPFVDWLGNVQGY
jgi:hypothetical protein